MNTIFYDKEKNIIVRRMEKKVNAEAKKGIMLTEKTVLHGTDKDPRLMVRAGVATALATKDNADKIMTDLEQSQTKITQLKETLKRERDESQILKRNYKYIISEIEESKAKCKTLQLDKDALVLSASNIERESKDTLSQFGRLQ